METIQSRRLAACTQAVVILRSTGYIICFAFEFVRNSMESMFSKPFCLSLHFFEKTNSLLFVCRLLGREMTCVKVLHQPVNVSVYCRYPVSLVLLLFLRFSSKRDEHKGFTRGQKLVSCCVLSPRSEITQNNVCVYCLESTVEADNPCIMILLLPPFYRCSFEIIVISL